MQLHCTSDGLLISGLTDFSLSDTFECGQCFRWEAQPDGSYQGVAYGRPLHIRPQGPGCFLLCACTRQEYDQIWQEYFDLERDYAAIRASLLSLDCNMAQACANAPGIRILRQEPWEALCSFIISQNNNIPRIKGILQRFCQAFGAKIGEQAFAFPDVNMVASLCVEDLAPLRCGFRAKYLIDAARKITEGQVSLTRAAVAPIEEARLELMKILGVGPKVAECTLLYGMGRLEAFPMDVWMKRAMALLFPGRTPAYFGPYAGIAQQYIFHYCRAAKLRSVEENAG